MLVLRLALAICLSVETFKISCLAYFLKVSFSNLTSALLDLGGALINFVFNSLVIFTLNLGSGCFFSSGLITWEGTVTLSFQEL